ncbi:carbohydrate-binding module family 13 protein [Amanita rubescens]|nr:carbohydrate-binding module family 13 protein [Amanita rubescens]
MAFQGTYNIINVESGTVMDQSGTDHVSIIGWPANGGDNQQWDVQPTSNGNYYAIKNVYFGTYLGYRKLILGANAIGVEFPIPWALFPDEQDPTTYRFFVPKSDLNLEVARHGSDKPGTPIVIASQIPEPNQTWRFQRVETREGLQTLSIGAYT